MQIIFVMYCLGNSVKKKKMPKEGHDVFGDSHIRS